MRRSKIFVIVVALLVLSVATTYGLVDVYSNDTRSALAEENQLQEESKDALTNDEVINQEAEKEVEEEKEVEKEDSTKEEKAAVVEASQNNQTGSTPTKVTQASQTKAEKSSDEAAAKKAAAEKAAAEKAAAKTAAEKAAAEKAAAKKAAEKAAAEKAAAEKAAAKKAASKPTRADGTPNQGYINEILNLVNAERAAAGKPALKLDSRLCNAAQLKVEDMAKNNYFDHYSPTYGSPFDMMRYLGIGFSCGGENVAYGYRTPQGVMSGWMESAGHRCNILDEKGYGFTKIGIGYTVSSDGTAYWSQLFCG